MTPAQKEAWDLDEATVSLIEDRFYFREICDDEKMTRFFQRTLDTVRDRYNEMIRVETIKFDPLVSKYFEGEFTTDGTNSSERNTSNNGSTTNNSFNSQETTNYEHTDNDLAVTRDYEKKWGDSDESGSFSKSGHDSKNGNETTNGSVRSNKTDFKSGRTDSSNTETTTGNVSHSFIDRHAIKQAPMSASGVVTGENGKLGGLDFDYSSMYEQNDRTENTQDLGSTNTSIGNATNSENGQSNATDTTYATKSFNEGGSNSESGSNTNGRDYTDETTKQYSDERDITVDGSSTVSGSATNTAVNTGSSKETNDASNYQIRHDRYTGRDNVLPQDALKSAMNYLQNYSTAFEWLCNKLEINFIGVYDI